MNLDALNLIEGSLDCLVVLMRTVTRYLGNGITFSIT